MGSARLAQVALTVRRRGAVPGGPSPPRQEGAGRHGSTLMRANRWTTSRRNVLRTRHRGPRRLPALRHRRHRRRHQWLRDRPRRGRTRALGLPVRAGGPRERDVFRVDQADPRRPALPRAPRVQARSRIPVRARASLGDRAAHRLASALRAAASPRHAAGLAAAARTVPVRSPRRAKAVAGQPDARSGPGRGRRSAEARSVRARVRILGLLGGRRPARGPQRPRRAGARRDDPDPHASRVGRTGCARVDPDHARQLHRRRERNPRPDHRQCGRAVGRPRPRVHAGCRDQLEDPARAGLAHRGAAPLRSRPLLHVPERRRPHRLRHPLRGRVHADRHDGPGFRGRSRRRRRDPGRDRVSVPGGERILCRAGHAGRGRVDL